MCIISIQHIYLLGIRIRKIRVYPTQCKIIFIIYVV